MPEIGMMGNGGTALAGSGNDPGFYEHARDKPHSVDDEAFRKVEPRIITGRYIRGDIRLLWLASKKAEDNRDLNDKCKTAWDEIKEFMDFLCNEYEVDLICDAQYMEPFHMTEFGLRINAYYKWVQATQSQTLPTQKQLVFISGAPWWWEPGKLFQKGSFNLLIGRSRVGKSNTGSKLGLMLADNYDMNIITNLAYFEEIFDKYENIQQAIYLSDMVLQAAKNRLANPRFTNIFWIDELAASMNTTIAVIDKRAHGFMETWAWQAGKMEACIVGFFQDPGDAATKIRNKKDILKPGPHSEYTLLKGYGLDCKDGKEDLVELERGGQEAYKNLVVKFKKKAGFQITDFKYYDSIYNHEQPSKLKVDLDMTKLYEVLAKMKGAWSKEDLPKWRENMMKRIIQGIETEEWKYVSKSEKWDDRINRQEKQRSEIAQIVFTARAQKEPTGFRQLAIRINNEFDTSYSNSTLSNWFARQPESNELPMKQKGKKDTNGGDE